MATQDPTFEDVLSLVKQLTPGQKLCLIEAIVPDLEAPFHRAQEGEQPLLSLYGLWEDFGLTRNSHDPEGDSAGCLPARGFATYR